MNKFRSIVGAGTAALAALASIGCGGGGEVPPAADPAKARAAVTSALESWKRGEKPSQLQSATPAVQVSDEDWLGGHQLESYELGSTDTARGLNQQYPVVLTLKSPKGRRMTKKVTYSVATEPTLTVVRQETN